MSVDRTLFEKHIPPLMELGFQIIPCYNHNPNRDFKEVNKTHSVLPRGWNVYENNPYAVNDLSSLAYETMISAMVLVPPGFVVLDLDRKDEAQAVLADKILTELKPHLPRTLVVKTASGGYHFYYKVSRKINAAKYKTCIDIQQESLRGKGAGKSGKGVWAPGCVRDGVGTYTVVIDHEIAELPDKVISLLEEKVTANDAQALVNEEVEDSGFTPVDLFPKHIGKGDRNNTLYRICGGYYARGIPKEATKALLTLLVTERTDNSDGEITEDDIDSMLERTYSQDNDIPDRSVDIIKYCLDRFIHEKANNRVIDTNGGLVHKFHNALKVFANLLYEVEVNGKPKLLNAIDVWSKHPKKVTVEYVGYKPRESSIYTCPRTGKRMYNTYEPPVLFEGEVSEDEEVWDNFKYLSGHLIPEMPEYLVNYAAHMVQRPDKKLSVATVIFSEHRGVGKNLYFDILSNLVGRSNSVAGNINDFLGQFNMQFATSHNILVDEAEHRPTANQMARFKSLITEDFVRIEPKGIDSYTIPAYFNFLIFANMMDNFPVEVGDRRFNMFTCPNTGIPIEKMRVLTRLGTNKMNIKGGVNLEGLQYLRNRLAKYEINEELFSGHSRAVDTRTKEFVREASLPEIVQNLLKDLRQGIGAFRGDVITKPLIKAHAARYYNYEMRPNELKDFIQNSGQITKLPYVKNPLQPRMVVLPQFFIDRMMYLKSDHKSGEYCYLCRNHEHYPSSVEVPVIREEYMKGYDMVTAIGGDATLPMVDEHGEDLTSKVH